MSLLLLSSSSSSINPFLGAFAKFAKNDFPLSHVRLSVRPFVRIEQLCCHWTDFDEK
jgi:hypothetical protein